jgi:hypothetical protein
VSLGKLKRSFQREMARSPGKVWTLLALLPVAGYFIVPLIWKQLPVSKDQSATGPSVAAATVATIPELVGSATSFRWQEVASWMAQDVRMKSASASELRNPFQKVITPEELARKAELEAKEKIQAAPSLRPEDLGLQLTATIVGQGKRFATINGRLYAEGARVRIGQGVMAPAAGSDQEAFVLKTVAKNYVLLERRGKPFRLQIAGSDDVAGTADQSPAEK